MRKQEAILLDNPGLSIEGKKVARILGFFGVPWRALTTRKLLAHNAADRESSSNCRLMSSSDTLLQLINGLERDPAFMQFWEERVHSAFVYAGDNSEILRKLIRRLTGDDGIVISKINPGAGDLTVSDQLHDFCKVMAGVRTAASKARSEEHTSELQSLTNLVCRLL